MRSKTLNRDQIVDPTGPVERPPDPTLDDWISALHMRGVTFSISNNRLRLSPWDKLSAEDRAFFRRHREDIKNRICVVVPAVPVLPKAPKAADQAAARDAQLKEHNLAAWRVIHYNDPDEIERRRVEATTLMTRVRRPAFPNL
jgi:hypothetical protein